MVMMPYVETATPVSMESGHCDTSRGGTIPCWIYLQKFHVFVNSLELLNFDHLFPLVKSLYIDISI